MKYGPCYLNLRIIVKSNRSFASRASQTGSVIRDLASFQGRSPSYLTHWGSPNCTGAIFTMDDLVVRQNSRRIRSMN